jgi:hypothetical protein
MEAAFGCRARRVSRGAVDRRRDWGERGRGWALSQAVAILAYYTPESNRTPYREAERWLYLVLSERA